MRLVLILFLLCCFHRVNGLNQDVLDPHLYEQARSYNSTLADSYYCWKIPEGAFLEFLDMYERRPIPVNIHGMRSQGNFFLWYLLREICPALVIESGVFRGQSTWTIEQAAPGAQIIAIDPDPSQRRYHSQKAMYMTDDFSTLAIPKVEGPIVCFFDDHINAFDRVMQAHAKGIKYLIFDDNYPACTPQEIYHLTLSNCFEMKRFKKKKEILQKIIKHYYIMPQIVGKTSNHPACSRVTTQLPAIWEKLEDVDAAIRNRMRVFADDSVEYRWVTYVELF